jgi:hypothetical protein
MEAVEYPIILNVYELLPPAGQEDGVATVSFFARLLKPIGFGAYHTSLELNGYCYTFSAMAGIQKSSAANKASHVPANGRFKESIKIGGLSDSMDQNAINECINRLRKSFFTDKSYHLACRNCNHFTETFATTLILADHQGLDEKKSAATSLSTYPSWINRLAKSGAGFINHGDVCNVLNEAQSASGLEGKVDWTLKTTLTSASSKKKSHSCQRNQKKELTEAQKKALEKLRKR